MINIILGIDGVCFLKKIAQFFSFFSNFWSKTIIHFIVFVWIAAIANGVHAEKVAQDTKDKENKAIERALVAERIANDAAAREKVAARVWGSQ